MGDLSMYARTSCGEVRGIVRGIEEKDLFSCSARRCR